MTVYLKHPVTDIIDAYPDHYRNHPVFGQFEEVSKEAYDHSGCPDCGLEPEVILAVDEDLTPEPVEELSFRWPEG